MLNFCIEAYMGIQNRTIEANFEFHPRSKDMGTFGGFLRGNIGVQKFVVFSFCLG